MSEPKMTKEEFEAIDAALMQSVASALGYSSHSAIPDSVAQSEAGVAEMLRQWRDHGLCVSVTSACDEGEQFALTERGMQYGWWLSHRQAVMEMQNAPSTDTIQ